MSVLSQTFTLNTGAVIPKLGFGTWQAPDDVAPQAVQTALAAGYTHIDTARAYDNEAGVGQGLRASGLDREQLFVTTKVPAEFKSYEQTKESIQTSLRELNIGYIDLLLIHAPKPWSQMFGHPEAPNYFEENLQMWKAMEEAYQRGEVKAIGVSNFDVADLQNFLDHAEVRPAANQIRFHIGHTQAEVTSFCQDQGIVVEAYSPIGTGRLLTNADIVALAGQYGVSPAQFCIAYTLQKGTVSLPKSTHAEYIKANTEVDFEISAADMVALDAIVVD